MRAKPCGANFLRPNPIANLRQKTCRNAAGRARGHYGAGSALQEPHTARPNQSSVGMASTNPRGGSMGLQGPPYAVLSPLVTDPLAPPGDPESSLFLTCHFVRKGSWRTKSPDRAKPARLMGTSTGTTVPSTIHTIHSSSDGPRVSTDTHKHTSCMCITVSRY